MDLLYNRGSNIMKLTKQYIASLFPARPQNANKGTFGKVLVFAGSDNFPGAAYLCCAAAYRVGAGLVTLATESQVKIIVSKILPELTFLLQNEALNKIGEYDALLVGSGLGQSNKTTKLMKSILDKKLPPAVIDADGLNILSQVGEWWRRLGSNVILTPHPGEMARLTGKSVREIQANRNDVAQYFAKKWNKIIVLKGANTVIVSPAGKVSLSPFANPVLATAGTGDILSGVIVGLLVQGLESLNAACAGVYIHGLAGEEFSKKTSKTGMLASDLLLLIPQIIRQLV